MIIVAPFVRYNETDHHFEINPAQYNFHRTLTLLTSERLI